MLLVNKDLHKLMREVTQVAANVHDGNKNIWMTLFKTKKNEQIRIKADEKCYSVHKRSRQGMLTNVAQKRWIKYAKVIQNIRRIVKLQIYDKLTLWTPRYSVTKQRSLQNSVLDNHFVH